MNLSELSVPAEARTWERYWRQYLADILKKAGFNDAASMIQ